MTPIARKTFVEGYAPHLSTQALEGLAAALRADDKRLVQGATTVPSGLRFEDAPLESGDCFAFAALADGMTTVGEADDYFGMLCFHADERLNETGACRHFLNWYDDAPRTVMVRGLLEVVEEVLNNRTTSHGA